MEKLAPSMVLPSHVTDVFGSRSDFGLTFQPAFERSVASWFASRLRHRGLVEMSNTSSRYWIRMMVPGN